MRNGEQGYVKVAMGSGGRILMKLKHQTLTSYRGKRQQNLNWSEKIGQWTIPVYWNIFIIFSTDMYRAYKSILGHHIRSQSHYFWDLISDLSPLYTTAGRAPPLPQESHKQLDMQIRPETYVCFVLACFAYSLTGM